MEVKVKTYPIPLSEKQRFVRLWLKGMTITAMAKETGFSWKTISKWIRRWRECGSLNRKRKFTPKLVSSYTPRQIAENNTLQTAFFDEQLRKTFWNSYNLNSSVYYEPYLLNYCPLCHSEYWTGLSRPTLKNKNDYVQVVLNSLSGQW